MEITSADLMRGDKMLDFQPPPLQSLPPWSQPEHLRQSLNGGTFSGSDLTAR